MKYKLSEHIWNKLWKDFDYPPSVGKSMADMRVMYWDLYYKPKYRLSYTEAEYNSFKKGEEYGLWGIVEGSEADINIFLLSI